MVSTIFADSLQVLGISAAILGVIASVVWFVILRSGVTTLRDIRDALREKKASD